MHSLHATVTGSSKSLPPSSKNVLDLLIRIAPSTCIAHHSIFSSRICLNCVWESCYESLTKRGGDEKKKNIFTFDAVLQSADHLRSPYKPPPCVFFRLKPKSQSCTFHDLRRLLTGFNHKFLVLSIFALYWTALARFQSDKLGSFPEMTSFCLSR